MPTPSPYSIEWDAYPTHALVEPSAGCNQGSATPSGSMVISPHYIVEVDMTSEPFGQSFNSNEVISQTQIEELIRNWDYVRPAGKFVQYQQLIAPAAAQRSTDLVNNLYAESLLGYFDTTFTGSQFLSVVHQHHMVTRMQSYIHNILQPQYGL